MNLSKQEQAQDITNVVSLFGRTNDEGNIFDPLADLLAEASLEDFMLDDEIMVQPILADRKVVDENQFPDQSIFVLEEQLSKLKTNLNRIKFYLGDMDDLLIR